MTLKSSTTYLSTLLLTFSLSTSATAQTETSKTIEENLENVSQTANSVIQKTATADKANANEKTIETSIKQPINTQTSTAPCSKHKAKTKSLTLNNDTQTTINSEMRTFQKMEKQWYKKRREAYNQSLEDKNLQLKTDSKARRDEFIKHMEERREFYNRMNELRRKEFEQRKNERLQNLHRTDIPTSSELQPT